MAEPELAAFISREHLLEVRLEAILSSFPVYPPHNEWVP
jgi:hypothetical protein